MAKVKGFNPPETEFAYEDADGVLHYFGEFFRMIFGEGSVDPADPETDIIGETRRGERPTQQGEGTESQRFYRKAFKDCTKLWNSLPEECPDPLPDPPPTSKKSVWDAKIEHGVPCSYYDLFMKCCIQWANWHAGDMPVGDCFPCVVECIEDPAMAWDYETSGETVAPGGSVVVAITGLNAPFSWSVSGTGFSLEHSTTEGVSNTLHADEATCGAAIITVTGCDNRIVVGSINCTIGQWIFHEDILVQACLWGNCLNPPPSPPDCTAYCGSGTWTKRMWRVNFNALSSTCTHGDNPTTSYNGNTITLSALTGCSAPFLSFPAKSEYNRTAHFYRWGC